jgi:hypothetical protein
MSLLSEVLQERSSLILNMNNLQKVAIVFLKYQHHLQTDQNRIKELLVKLLIIKTFKNSSFVINIYLTIDKVNQF